MYTSVLLSIRISLLLFDITISHLFFLQPYTHITYIQIGTGITPMIQALHAILGDGPKEQQSATEEVTLLYGSRNSDDILGGEMLQHWAASTHSNKFNYVDVLSNEPTESEYDGERGFIDKEKILKYLPPPTDDDVIIFVCGPPIMYKLLCGPRDETEITGILGELGYTSNQVYKF